MSGSAVEGKAWQMTAVGKPSDSSLASMVTRRFPPLEPDQVLVKVAAAALNPIDYKLAEGHMTVAGKPPLFLGGDFAGIVVDAGSESGFAKGQDVFGDVLNKNANNPTGGSLSEYILVPGKSIAPKPERLTSAEACSLPLVGQTVLDCLARAELKRKLPSDARVLILGASGGVGTVGIQICKARGFHTIGVCSAKNRDLVLSLGADEVIDYRANDWSEQFQESAQKVDVVLDFAPSGPDSSNAWLKAKRVLKRGRQGEFITISGPDEQGKVTLGGAVALVSKSAWRNTFSGFKYRLVLKTSSTEKLLELKQLVDEGKLKPVVEKVCSFEEVPAAYEHLMSGRAVGKICVSVP